MIFKANELLYSIFNYYSNHLTNESEITNYTLLKNYFVLFDTLTIFHILIIYTKRDPFNGINENLEIKHNHHILDNTVLHYFNFQRIHLIQKATSSQNKSDKDYKEIR
jgi:hypothetical protein